MSDVGGQPANFEGRSVGGGRYQLGRLLGAGGMASVHLGHDNVLDRQVAVKTLHSELGREAAFRERFRREAQSVAKLTHTNIAAVFDSGEDEIDGAMVPFIVMEYVDGPPLRSRLDEDVAQFGAMPTDSALKVTSDVLAALDTSHEMGLVHRDIKPGNVMLNRRNVVKVMDFGIARAMQSGVTSMTQTGMVVGTPQYLSPEQALGRGVDARSDLYTVGIMLFELLTGRLPFDADSPLAIAYAHVQEEPVAPSTINASIPPAVDALVGRALRKNPNERFPSAEAMQQEVDRIRHSGAASGLTPTIIGTGPAQSGAGIAQSVFPPVGSATTPPSSTPPPGGYATPSPYGQQGYGTPPPGTAPMGQVASYSGSQPAYNQNNGGTKNLGMIVAAAVTAIVVVAAVGIIIALNRGGDGDSAGTGGGDNGGSSASAGVDPGTDPDTDTGADPDTGANGDDEDDDPTGKFKEGDKTRTIESEKCTDARPYFSDRDKEDPRPTMPDFEIKHIDSVKACIEAAGWKLDTDYSEMDENTYGKGTVMSQSPRKNGPYDPKTEIKITISTGKPSS
ncbi:protein kinase [Streptomyces sp. P38-E01]|uniref:non-specific serine/threonine protein kinase n=1 Tax=Streptomyces tardus TaxID=2780544 RepID=A0A949JFE7_9ACTN|nr:protein kinase [Streptomyces tardus]MBU7597570.1 protein kinase [Streptomyces tardus]